MNKTFSHKKTILVAGPTASGKSGLAMRLAQQEPVTIINADSMQVYKELRILTARPSRDDEMQVPHLLYGHVPAYHAYSTGQWLTDVKRSLVQVRQEGRRAVIVGGTGLYFKMLLEGLSEIPVIPDDIRYRWRRKGETLSRSQLNAILATKDPEMAGRLKTGDRQRIIRSLEVFEATGKSLLYWQSIPGKPVLNENETVRLVVAPDRDTVYQRINDRFVDMMERGAVEEVMHLLEQRLDTGLPAMRALGVRQIADWLAGTVSKEEAVSQVQMLTRRYSKRQFTWLRGNMMSWKWLDLEYLQRNEPENFINID